MTAKQRLIQKMEAFCNYLDIQEEDAYLRLIDQYGKEVAKNVRHTSIELVNKHSHVVEIQRGKGVRIVSDVDNLNRDIMNIQFSEIDPK